MMIDEPIQEKQLDSELRNKKMNDDNKSSDKIKSSSRRERHHRGRGRSGSSSSRSRDRSASSQSSHSKDRSSSRRHKSSRRDHHHHQRSRRSNSRSPKDNKDNHKLNKRERDESRSRTNKDYKSGSSNRRDDDKRDHNRRSSRDRGDDSRRHHHRGNSRRSRSRDDRRRDYDRDSSRYQRNDKENRDRDNNNNNRDRDRKQNSNRDQEEKKTLPDRRPEDFEVGTMKPVSTQRNAMMPAAAGGVYMPPFKMRQMLEELKNKDKTSLEHQKYMWEMLRKSINGIVNKVNTSNLQNIILELFNENLLRGKGLLARAIMKAQMASPNFSHVYAALIAVINTKLPDLVRLIINRYIIQFQRAYKRNNKIVCMGTTRMLAHLVNQQVIHEILALELLTLMLENPTEDSVEIAADFMIECGQVLTDITPAGVNAIFERFRTILHEGEIPKKVQYTIENLFAIRKTRFAEHPGVIPELDLVEDDDKITHNVSLEETELDGQEETNVFNYDPNYEQTEAEWDEIKKEILGEVEDERMNKIGAGLIRPEGEEESEESEEEEDKNQILDFTEKDLVNLRRSIYLVIMSSIDFEEVVHKLMKLNLREGQEMELCNMVLECNMQERTYLKFFGFIGQRLCQLNEIYQQKFHELFMKQYLTVHRLEINKLRNAAKFLAHLLYTDVIDWTCLSCIRLTEDDTTASSRIFIKILFQELAENMGMDNLRKKLSDETLKPHLENLFPRDSVQNARFSINFFTSIGLGAITEELREFLQNAPKLLLEKKYAELLAQANASSSESDSDSDDSDDSDSSSGSDSSDSSSEEEDRKKKKRK